VDYVLVHSSQKDPLGLHRSVYAWQEDIFLPQEFAALEERSLTSGRPSIQLYGHTHVPTLVYGQRVGEDFAYHAVKVCPGQTYSLEAGLAIINPGSVGFPRDRDNRAAYTLLDTAGRMLTFLRVGYDWMETAQKLAREGYPDLLRNRLRFADVAGDTPQDWKKHFEKVREC
jgi:diadenosine tetraphosphatase ApaH/serine/threonine PP2A family protein phosphatase